MSFGQFVIGQAGSGKTTYCEAMYNFLTHGLGREVAIINLDPANDKLPYDAAVCISELVTMDKAMEEHKLGPNGAILHCMEVLEKNLAWLKKRIDAIRFDSEEDSNRKEEKVNGGGGRSGSSVSKDDPLEVPNTGKNVYFLFDLPGQIELSTTHDSLRKCLHIMQKEWDLTVVTVNLVDSLYCLDPYRFVASLSTTLCAMIHLETPHLNVLTKIDLLPTLTSGSRVSSSAQNQSFSGGSMRYSLEEYTRIGTTLNFISDDLTAEMEQELVVLRKYLKSRGVSDDGDKEKDTSSEKKNKVGVDRSSKGRRGAHEPPCVRFLQNRVRMYAQVCELVGDYGLLQFCPLTVRDKDSMYALVKLCDKSVGYLWADFPPKSQVKMEADNEMSKLLPAFHELLPIDPHRNNQKRNKNKNENKQKDSTNNNSTATNDESTVVGSIPQSGFSVPDLELSDYTRRVVRTVEERWVDDWEALSEDEEYA